MESFMVEEGSTDQQSLQTTTCLSMLQMILIGK